MMGHPHYTTGVRLPRQSTTADVDGNTVPLTHTVLDPPFVLTDEEQALIRQVAQAVTSQGQPAIADQPCWHLTQLARADLFQQEMTAIEKARQARRLIIELIAMEADEALAGENESWDLRNLSEALTLLDSFIMSEHWAAVMELMEDGPVTSARESVDNDSTHVIRMKCPDCGKALKLHIRSPKVTKADTTPDVTADQGGDPVPGMSAEMKAALAAIAQGAQAMVSATATLVALSEAEGGAAASDTLMPFHVDGLADKVDPPAAADTLEELHVDVVASDAPTEDKPDTAAFPPKDDDEKKKADADVTDAATEAEAKWPPKDDDEDAKKKKQQEEDDKKKKKADADVEATEAFKNEGDHRADRKESRDAGASTDVTPAAAALINQQAAEAAQADELQAAMASADGLLGAGRRRDFTKASDREEWFRDVFAHQETQGLGIALSALTSASGTSVTAASLAAAAATRVPVAGDVEGEDVGKVLSAAAQAANGEINLEMLFQR